jgi:NAD(P)H dehydrogenase (quinone)
MKSVLVIGARGDQGFAIAQEFVSAGYHVKGLVTSPSGIEKLTMASIEPVVANLNNRQSLTHAFDNVDVLSITFPTTFDKGQLIKFTENVIAAAQKSSLKKVVYNTSTWYPHRGSYALVHQIKQEQERLFIQSQLPVIILRPFLYLENIVGPWALPDIIDNGVFAYPILATQKIPWISHRDLAKFTRKAIEIDTLNTGRFDIGKLISGNEIASELTDLIGRPVRFESISVADFEKQLQPIFGAHAKNIADSYLYTQQYPLEQANPQPLESSSNTFNIIPLTFKQWFNYYVKPLVPIMG